MSSQRAKRKSTETIGEKPRQQSIPLAELKNARRTDLPYKVGNLFFEFLANTYLPALGYRSTDVAELLEAQGLIETRIIDGSQYYKWTKPKLSKSQFLRLVLPKSK
jgi:hypothetical protein